MESWQEEKRQRIFLQGRIQSAVSATEKRIERGRQLAQLEITVEHLTGPNTCFYSGVPLVFKSKEAWSASLERLDPEKGYVLGNVALVAVEFNHSVQWSCEKLVECLRYRTAVVDEAQLKESIDLARIRPTRGNWSSRAKKTPTLQKDGVIHYQCFKCAEYKIPFDFPQCNGRSSIVQGCKVCWNRHVKEKEATLRSKVLDTIARARSNTQLRNLKARNQAPPELDAEFLLDLFWNQRGRCAYSGVRLTHDKGGPWRMSLERLDESKGYLRDNVVWIAEEFNTGHNLPWSKEKFDFMCKHAIVKYRDQLDALGAPQ